MSHIPPSQSRRRPAQVAQLDRGMGYFRPFRCSGSGLAGCGGLVLGGRLLGGCFCSGSKAQKTLPASSTPVATLPMGSSSGNAQDPEQAVAFPSMHTRALGKVLVDANKLLTAG